MLCSGALGSAGWRSSAEAHCRGHRFTRMLADGLVVDTASTLFSIHKMESSHPGVRFTGVAFLTGSTSPVLSPSVGAAHLSKNRGLPTYPGHLALKRNDLACRQDNGKSRRLTLAANLVESPPEAKKKKNRKERKGKKKSQSVKLASS